MPALARIGEAFLRGLRAAAEAARAHRRAVVDAAVLLGATAIVGAAPLLNQQLGPWAETGSSRPVSAAEQWLFYLIAFAVAFLVYSLRRVVELNQEVARRAAAERRLQEFARYDTLTGLPNRRQLADIFAEWRSSGRRRGADIAVLLINLDRFNAVNKIHGHDFGDEVLRRAAGLLSELVHKEQILVRLDGDEFAIVMNCAPASDAPLRLAQRITARLVRPVETGGVSLSLGASVGIAKQRTEDADLDMLLHQAEAALKRAKSGGRGTHRVFEQDADKALAARLARQPELGPAIRSGQIVPYYQPLVDLASGQTVGYEVLARWHHPKHGVIPPASFIPVAEDTGLIGEMTFALLRTACEEAGSLPPHIFLAVNLSPEQLTDKWLPHRIMGVLSRSGFPAGRLELEITEHALVERLDEVKPVLESLRNLGIGFALDDFGTGYSGLYHLRELRLDKIKIDRSFIAEILTDPERARVIEAIMCMNAKLGLRTTAEGIESAAVRDRLAALGCETGQGFLFGRPQPIAEVLRAIRGDRMAASA